MISENEGEVGLRGGWGLKTYFIGIKRDILSFGELKVRVEVV